MSVAWPVRRRPYAFVLLAYVVLRVGFAGVHPTRYTDTPGYESAGRASIWSVHFWAGPRGFTIPLVYKFIGNDTARIGFQLAFSIFAWCVLAAVFSRSLRSERGQFVGFVVVLLFSLTRYVVGWDPLLLSESLCFSLFALLVAAILVIVRRPSWPLAAMLLVLATAWAFARDSNSSVVLVGGLVALLLAIRPGHRPLKIAIGGVAIAIFLGTAVSADVGNRWKQPFVDVVAKRAQEQPSLRAAVLAPHRGLLAERRAYVVYLATHPVYLLVDPFFGTEDVSYSSPRKADALLNPHLDTYVATLNSTARPVRAVFDVVWIHSLPGVLAVAALALAGAAVASRGRRDACGWVGLAVLLSAYPTALAAWHLCGSELDRHALGAAISLRLGAYLLAAYALDALLAARKGERSSVADVHAA